MPVEMSIAFAFGFPEPAWAAFRLYDLLPIVAPFVAEHDDP